MTCQVDGLKVDNEFHPAQWLNHWVFAETVLKEVKTFLLLIFFNLLKAR